MLMARVALASEHTAASPRAAMTAALARVRYVDGVLDVAEEAWAEPVRSPADVILRAELVRFLDLFEERDVDLGEWHKRAAVELANAVFGLGRDLGGLHA